MLILGAILWTGAPALAGGMSPIMPIQVTGATLSAEQTQPLALVAPQSKTGAVAGVFAPAPMPDPDVDPPSGSVAGGPSLTPAIFAHKEEFAGDGYAAASDADHGLDHRRAPAAGLNWSVPVK